VTFYDLVRREVDPALTDAQADYILWEHTGFPSFFDGDPEETLIRQLQEYRDGLYKVLV